MDQKDLVCSPKEECVGLSLLFDYITHWLEEIPAKIKKSWTPLSRAGLETKQIGFSTILVTLKNIVEFHIEQCSIADLKKWLYPSFKLPKRMLKTLLNAASSESRKNYLDEIENELQTKCNNKVKDMTIQELVETLESHPHETSPKKTKAAQLLFECDKKKKITQIHLDLMDLILLEASQK